MSISPSPSSLVSVSARDTLVDVAGESGGSRFERLCTPPTIDQAPLSKKTLTPLVAGTETRYERLRGSLEDFRILNTCVKLWA
jgi:hypothetical protein